MRDVVPHSCAAIMEVLRHPRYEVSWDAGVLLHTNDQFVESGRKRLTEVEGEDCPYDVVQRVNAR
jgi:hypothetical protein